MKLSILYFFISFIYFSFLSRDSLADPGLKLEVVRYDENHIVFWEAKSRRNLVVPLVEYVDKGCKRSYLDTCELVSGAKEADRQNHAAAMSFVQTDFRKEIYKDFINGIKKIPEDLLSHEAGKLIRQKVRDEILQELKGEFKERLKDEIRKEIMAELDSKLRR